MVYVIISDDLSRGFNGPNVFLNRITAAKYFSLNRIFSLLDVERRSAHV
jgi:hypothetical protein